MRTDMAIRIEAMDLLLNTFRVLETERFITSIKNNNFDYTEWLKDLWKDKTIDEVHQMAVKFEEEKFKNHL